MIVVAIHRHPGGHRNPAFILQDQGLTNTAARADVKNALHGGNRRYFSDSPTGAVDVAKTQRAGVLGSTGVTLAVTTGTMAGLALTSAHGSGDKTYSINASGAITP